MGILEMILRVPGSALACGYLAWTVVAAQLTRLDLPWATDLLAAGLMIAPFLIWLAWATQRLHAASRSPSAVTPLLLGIWLLYALGGSARFGRMAAAIDLLFAVSVIAGFHRMASALIERERSVGRPGARYGQTLVELLFPPVALWRVHERLRALEDAVSPD